MLNAEAAPSSSSAFKYDGERLSMKVIVKSGSFWMPIWTRGAKPATNRMPPVLCCSKMMWLADSNPRSSSSCNSSFLFCAAATEAWAEIKFKCN